MRPADLNYNHLHYFWNVAKAGSVVAAARELLVSQPTISAQIRDLEKSLGVKLFDRSGRGLTLTETGRTVFRYAEEIFTSGQNMLEALHRHSAAPRRLTVGIADAVPKELARRLFAPALHARERVRIICREDKADQLLTSLAANRLDMVIGDAPLGASVHLRGRNFLLAESGMSFLATARVAARLVEGFPRSLDGAPMLLPSDAVAARSDLLEWFQRHRINPEINAEFDDLATMAAFGAGGPAVFPAPSVVEQELCKEYNVRVVGHARVIQRFYAVTTEERLHSPVVAAICSQKLISMGH